MSIRNRLFKGHLSNQTTLTVTRLAYQGLSLGWFD